jgi:GDP-L-fucose synthase
MVGSAIWRHLKTQGYTALHGRSHAELDLTDARQVACYLEHIKPDVVINAAAKVGGIKANAQAPADFIHTNLAIAHNLTHACYQLGIKRYLFLGSSCIYPKEAPQPICESHLLTGPLEPTNEAYAIAKIAGLKMCQYYRKQYGVCFHSVMPTNLYGPGDNYNLQTAHVLPALLRRFHEARENRQKKVVLWGTGQVKREFLHVDDLARAIGLLVALPNPPDWVNVGTGTDLTILELAKKIAAVTGYTGLIDVDPSEPSGTPRKCLDISLIRSLGWNPQISLDEGLKSTYKSFCQQQALSHIRQAP